MRTTRTAARACALAVVLALLAPGPAGAQREQQKKRLGAVASPIRLVPAGSQPLDVSGLHRFLGALELDAMSDGLVVVNRLPLEDYLLGLQEVPSRWPMEALKAQAVAARTYALWTLNRPRSGAAAAYGFDICATVACQVFSGAEIVLSPDGARWAQAVARTEREVVLYGGEPILARYHSTSGGRTFDNPQVFGGEPDYPYLKGVRSTTESGSPLNRWRVEFPLRRLERILRRAGWWNGYGRLDRVRTTASARGLHYPDVIFVGRRGRVRVTAEELRTEVRTRAPRMFPGAYPSRWQTTSGRLPETLPSNRFEIETRGRRAVVRGRGWGHGVGMSQWGAHGMAEDGAGYDEILRHYYTDVEVGVAAPAGPIAVGVAWGERRVEVSGEFQLIDGRGRRLVGDALGTWVFESEGSGAVRVRPPRGFGLPLEVGVVEAPEAVAPGAPASITIALSRPARVETRTRSRSEYEDPAPEVTDAGRQTIEWLAPRDPGTYEIVVAASASGARRTSDPVIIEVKEPEIAPEETPADSAAPESEEGAFPLLFAFGIAVLAIAAFGTLAGRIRR